MTDKLNSNHQPELSETDAELLSAYIDEMLFDDEHRNFEARLENEPFLRHELAAMRQTVAWMNALPTLKAPRDFTISADDVAPTEIAVERKVIPMQNRNWWLAASAAAMIVVIIGIAVILPSLTLNNGDVAQEVGNVAFANTQSAPSDNALNTEAQSANTSTGSGSGGGAANSGESNGAPVPQTIEIRDDDDLDETDSSEENLVEPVAPMSDTVTDDAARSANSQIPLEDVQQTATALASFLATPTQQTFSMTAQFVPPALTQTVSAVGASSDTVGGDEPYDAVSEEDGITSQSNTASSVAQGGGMQASASAIPTSTLAPQSTNVPAVVAAESTAMPEAETDSEADFAEAEVFADDDVAADESLVADDILLIPAPVENLFTIVQQIINLIQALSQALQP